MHAINYATETEEVSLFEMLGITTPTPAATPPSSNGRTAKPTKPWSTLLWESLSRGKTVTTGSTGRSIRIDEPRPHDIHELRCSIQIELSDAADHVTLELRNAPADEQIEQMIKRHGGECRREPPPTTLRIPIRRIHAPFVRQLATAIRRLVGRGKRYADANWKWQCPRIAETLEKLAAEMRAVRTATRQ